MDILDLGTGTGNLAVRFSVLGCNLWCTDFSESMLDKARAKLPATQFFCHDLRAEWPAMLERRFYRVISGYVFHHFELEKKVSLCLELAAQRLAPGGRLLIGDLSFNSQTALDDFKRGIDDWEDEFYWLADESVQALGDAGLNASYEQVSVLRNVHKSTQGRSRFGSCFIKGCLEKRSYLLSTGVTFRGTRGSPVFQIQGRIQIAVDDQVADVALVHALAQIQPGHEGTQHDHRTIVLRISCHSLLRFAQDRLCLNQFQLSVTIPLRRSFSYSGVDKFQEEISPCPSRSAFSRWKKHSYFMVNNFTYSTGNEINMVVPCPGALLAMSVPPCASTRCLAIASPRPMPPESVDL